MNQLSPDRPVEILLVEDSDADVELTRIGLKGGTVPSALHVTVDGKQAMTFLRREGEFRDAPKPDVVLLDLNLPGMNGRQVLREIRSDQALKDIPIVVLTTSDAAPDIAEAYENLASAYMTKPVDFHQFEEVLKDLSDIWFTVIRLPPADGLDNSIQ